MKILLIGGGGREHALSWKLAQSKRISKIYCAPGNGGTGQVAENLNIAVNDIDGLLEFALTNQIDLTIVGPEEPLVLGIVDSFQERGLKIFGANKKSAQLEGSKEFSKLFLERHGIPTAGYKSFTDYEEAIKGLDSFTYPLVIKADGLCFGKGVIICKTKNEALKALEDILVNKAFGSEGNTVVIEDFLDGIEASLLCIVSKGKVIAMESARDYKQIFDRDQGPNTGGVGCYSPSELFTEDLKSLIEKEILNKIRLGLKEDNLEYSGILFIGLMIVEGQPKVLEFNVRFGDPETQVLMPRLKSDLMDIIEKAVDGKIKDSDLIWDDRPCMTLIATSQGYPGKYEKGFEIKGIEQVDKSIILFHNGTKYDNESLITNGGRVISITSLGQTINDARENIYKNVSRIKFQGMYYRRDIGIVK